jgi:hypothetical protein
MNMEHRWNDSNGSIPKHLERNLPYHYFVLLSSHRPVDNGLSHSKEIDVASQLCLLFMQKMAA